LKRDSDDWLNPILTGRFGGSEKLAGLRNFKFGMKLAPNKRSKKIMMNNQM